MAIRHEEKTAVVALIFITLVFQGTGSCVKNAEIGYSNRSISPWIVTIFRGGWDVSRVKFVATGTIVGPRSVLTILERSVVSEVESLEVVCSSTNFEAESFFRNLELKKVTQMLEFPYSASVLGYADARIVLLKISEYEAPFTDQDCQAIRYTPHVNLSSNDCGNEEEMFQGAVYGIWNTTDGATETDLFSYMGSLETEFTFACVEDRKGHAFKSLNGSEFLWRTAKVLLDAKLEEGATLVSDGDDQAFLLGILYRNITTPVGTIYYFLNLVSEMTNGHMSVSDIRMQHKHLLHNWITAAAGHTVTEEYEFYCSNGTTISWKKVCDEHADCGASYTEDEDRNLCGAADSCPEKGVRCYLGGPCISSKDMCDGGDAIWQSGEGDDRDRVHAAFRPQEEKNRRDECGRIDGRSKLIMDRINNGQETNLVVAHPWYAALYLWSPTRRNFYFACGGTLIHPLYVLTAAHCIPFSNDQQVWRYRVILGAKTIDFKRNVGSLESVLKEVEEISIPVEYRKVTLAWDIALIRLKGEEVEYKDMIRPACYLNKRFDNGSVPGGNGLIAGLGKDATESAHLRLQWAEFPLITATECSRLLSTEIRGNEFCVKFYNETALCEGDSGGGLVMREDGKNLSSPFVLRGILSRGSTRDGGSCGLSGGAVFTNASSILPWVTSVIGGDGKLVLSNR